MLEKRANTVTQPTVAVNRRVPTLYVLMVLVAVIGLVTNRAIAQNYVKTPALEELPSVAMDTINTEDRETKIIIYTNNTWSYYRPTLNEKFDHLPVYNEHWDTTQVFAYRAVEYASLPTSIDINLISSLSDFASPIVGKVLSKYGPRGRRKHNGVDIPLIIGEPIYTAFDGRVRYARYNGGGFGNLVIIRHVNGLETWHAHLSKLNVVAGEYVKSGQVLGFGGNTGRSRGPHLHFEMRYCDQNFDPEHIIDFETGGIKFKTFTLLKSFLNINSRSTDQLEDHDFDEYMSLASIDGQQVTSEDILSHIASVNDKSKENKPLSTSQSGAVYHTIKSGDMLGKLAIKYGVSVDQICRLNNIKPTTTLRLGRKLRVK